MPENQDRLNYFINLTKNTINQHLASALDQAIGTALPKDLSFRRQFILNAAEQFGHHFVTQASNSPNISTENLEAARNLALEKTLDLLDDQNQVFHNLIPPKAKATILKTLQEKIDPEQFQQTSKAAADLKKQRQQQPLGSQEIAAAVLSDEGQNF